jgi:uroporphyrinogen-III synthase
VASRRTAQQRRLVACHPARCGPRRARRKRPAWRSPPTCWTARRRRQAALQPRVRPLLILRPEPGASATAARARAGLTGGLPSRCSRPSRCPGPCREGSFDALLLTSANAVRLAGALPDLPVHAVGETSAARPRRRAEVATVGTAAWKRCSTRCLATSACFTSPARSASCPGPRQHITSVTVYRMVPLPLPAAAAVRGAVVLSTRPPPAAAWPSGAGARAGAGRGDQPGRGNACGSGWERCEAADGAQRPRLAWPRRQAVRGTGP